MSIPANTKQIIRSIIAKLGESISEAAANESVAIEAQHIEMRHLIAANLAYANKCAAEIDSDPRTIAGLLSLPIHQLAYLAGLTGESRWKVHADALNEQKLALNDQWAAGLRN